jgi:hypothetical protein
VLAARFAEVLGLPNPEDLTVNVRAGINGGSRRRRDLCDTGVIVRAFIANVPEPLVAVINAIIEAAAEDESLFVAPDGTPFTAAICKLFAPFGKYVCCG